MAAAALGPGMGSANAAEAALGQGMGQAIDTQRSWQGDGTSAIAITQIPTHRRNRYGSCRDGEGGALDGRAMAKGPGITLLRAS